jgi:hypothetical protein
MFIGQPRLLATSIAAVIADWARCNEIGGP